jgi:hypothetical protein
MFQQFRDRQVYWFCRHCWAEMPTLPEMPDLAPDLENEPETLFCDRLSRNRLDRLFERI